MHEDVRYDTSHQIARNNSSSKILAKGKDEQDTSTQDKYIGHLFPPRQRQGPAFQRGRGDKYSLILHPEDCNSLQNRLIQDSNDRLNPVPPKRRLIVPPILPRSARHTI